MLRASEARLTRLLTAKARACAVLCFILSLVITNVAHSSHHVFSPDSPASQEILMSSPGLDEPATDNHGTAAEHCCVCNGVALPALAAFAVAELIFAGVSCDASPPTLQANPPLAITPPPRHLV